MVKRRLDLFDLNFGKSDISIKGYLSDLPAIVHHTNIPVDVHLDIKSNKLDISEITRYSKKNGTGVDEQIENLNVGVSFQSSARAFTESKNLPLGEFFVDNLYAELKHYPHKLHDFHVDILVGERDLKIKDFTGYIDDSDFHFNGLALWFLDGRCSRRRCKFRCHTKFRLVALEDLFSYGGENYVPEDYRHEELDGLV